MMDDRKANLLSLLVMLSFVAVVWGCTNGRESSEMVAVRKAVPPKSSVDVEKAVSAPEPLLTGGAALLQDDRDLFSMAEKKPGYSAEGKIDPFKPLFSRKADPDPPPKPGPINKPKLAVVDPCGPTPLTRVGLENLKLVAILRGGSGDYALVEDASGKGYVLRNHVCIGIHSGRVTEINSEGVVIQERFQDVELVDDQWRPAGILTRERTLTLPRENGA
jgi:type IV pilus assembly protein PilP